MPNLYWSLFCFLFHASSLPPHATPKETNCVNGSLIDKRSVILMHSQRTVDLPAFFAKLIKETVQSCGFKQRFKGIETLYLAQTEKKCLILFRTIAIIIVQPCMKYMSIN